MPDGGVEFSGEQGDHQAVGQDFESRDTGPPDGLHKDPPHMGHDGATMQGAGWPGGVSWHSVGTLSIRVYPRSSAFYFPSVGGARQPPSACSIACPNANATSSRQGRAAI